MKTENVLRTAYGMKEVNISDIVYRDLKRRIVSMEWAREQTLSWLMQQKVEFVPTVKNPDPTQLERLGVPKSGLKKAIMGAAEGRE